MDMDNPICDGPPLVGGLEVLAMIAPTLGNNILTHIFLELSKFEYR